MGRPETSAKPYGLSRYEPAQKKVVDYAPDPRGPIPFDDLPIPARDHPDVDRVHAIGTSTRSTAAGPTPSC